MRRGGVRAKRRLGEGPQIRQERYFRAKITFFSFHSSIRLRARFKRHFRKILRNYIEFFYAKYHVTLPPNFQADGEIWRRDQDRLDAEIANQRSIWTSAGWSFTLLAEMPAYFK